MVTTDTKGWNGGLVDIQSTQEMLDQMGEQGWELENVVSTHMGQGTTRCIVHYFKREI